MLRAVARKDAERPHRRPVRRRAGPAGAAERRGGGPVPRPVQAALERRPGFEAALDLARAGRRRGRARRPVRRRGGQRLRGPRRPAHGPARARRAPTSRPRASRSRPRSTPCAPAWPPSPTPSARAPRRARPASRSAPSSTSASAARTWARALVWEALRPLEPADRPALRRQRRSAPTSPRPWPASIPPTTLVVVVSKTFTTQETLANAEAGRAWLARGLWRRRPTATWSAVSAAPDKAEAFGVPADRVRLPRLGRRPLFAVVGGGPVLRHRPGLGRVRAPAGRRARPWTTTSVAAPLERNAPVLLALAQIFNRNGLGRPARAGRALRPAPAPAAGLPAAAGDGVERQAGDSATARPSTAPPAPAVFGDAGTNVQHAFFQLMHQGTDVDPGRLRRRAPKPRGRRAGRSQAAGQRPRPGRGPDGRAHRGRGRAPSCRPRALPRPRSTRWPRSGPSPATGPRPSSCWTA